jgi:hypothetical protein
MFVFNLPHLLNAEDHYFHILIRTLDYPIADNEDLRELRGWIDGDNEYCHGTKLDVFSAEVNIVGPYGSVKHSICIPCYG